MIKPVLRKIKRLANKIFGTRVDELYWEYRHIFDKKWAESYISKQTIEHPHGKILIDAISKYFPFESILEIGCASGPNLYLLSKEFPEVKFYGIDISKKAVKTGNEFLKKENVNNVFLSPGKAEELKNFQDKSIDVIFTVATLIYQGPERIEPLIKEMLRVAKKSLILCEQHSSDSQFFYKDLWIYDYKSLFSKFIPEKRITITKLPSESEGEDWGKFGYIIEVLL